jgi:UDP-glucose 4-epimerase
MAQVALICGAGGFIGYHTTAYFHKHGWNVVGAGRSSLSKLQNWPEIIPYFSGDFADRNFTQDLLTKVQPDYLIYLAAPSSVPNSFEDPFNDFCKQTQPLFSVLEASIKLPTIPKVLLVSSGAVYGNPSHLPVSEYMQPAPISPYGFHKLQQESIADEFFKLFNVPICKARIFSTFGPGLKKLAVWEIARRALERDFSIQGSGQESRDYLYIEDIANALDIICSRGDFRNEVINVASGYEMSIKTLSNLIYQLLDIDEKPNFTGKSTLGTPQQWCADIRYLQSLGFEQSISFETGIAETMTWIKMNLLGDDFNG